MRDADAHHVALLEVGEGHPGATGFEHPRDDRARTSQRGRRDGREHRERRIVHDRPSTGLEALSDSGGLFDRALDVGRVARPSGRRRARGTAAVPRKRRDHCTEFMYGSTDAWWDGM